ncbi:borealin-2-like [Oncorhynchus keta]|uniref:borealin-2-like n=1 Tax=Oncorhynchus keta TaxID=8018 RepID=UPI00227A0864|nr:borealin-2-like [Oncorhynchus keta]
MAQALEAYGMSPYTLSVLASNRLVASFVPVHHLLNALFSSVRNALFSSVRNALFWSIPLICSCRSATSTSTKITKTRIAKISDQSPLTGMKHRSVLRSASDDHLHCYLSGLSPHVMISTSHGETLCLSDDTVEDVDIGLLDDMAVLQMQKLMQGHLSPRTDLLPHCSPAC